MNDNTIVHWSSSGTLPVPNYPDNELELANAAAISDAAYTSLMTHARENEIPRNLKCLSIDDGNSATLRILNSRVNRSGMMFWERANAWKAGKNQHHHMLRSGRTYLHGHKTHQKRRITKAALTLYQLSDDSIDGYDSDETITLPVVTLDKADIDETSVRSTSTVSFSEYLAQVGERKIDENNV